MSLLNRINHVLNAQQATSQRQGWHFGLIALLVPAILFMYFPGQMSSADEEINRPAQAPQEILPSEINESSSDLGEIGNRPAVAHVPAVPPTELTKISLPKYQIAPPDILLIQGVRLNPNDNYQLAPQDSIQLVTTDLGFAKRVSGRYTIDRDGTINLGSDFGSINVAGMNFGSAKKAIAKQIKSVLNKSDVSLTFTLHLKQAIGGEHLVGPDGHVNLGTYGEVYLAGMTIEAATQTIEKHLGEFFVKPSVCVDVFAYNSHFYYIVTKSDGQIGDSVIRIPITGNETVLDAIAQVGGLTQLSDKSIWICRPGPNGMSENQILPVDWNAITHGASTSTNYQILPGDRVFVSDKQAENVAIDGDTSVETVVEKFNKLVEQKDYAEAISVARKLQAAQPDNAIAMALQHHADLIEKSILVVQAEQRKHYACLVNSIREQRQAKTNTERALSQKVSVDFDNTPLKDAIQVIAKNSGLNIVFDQGALDAAAVDGKPLVSMKLNQPVKVKSALHLCLEPYNLTYAIRGDGILITNPAAIKRNVVVAYGAKDLLGLPYLVNGETTEMGEEEFIHLITSTIAPESWDDTGGEGSIQYFPGNQSFVVGNSVTVHQEISQLLGQLQKIAKEIRNGRADEKLAR
jgi:protein involved in polysaccharide export with SLBB domain